MDENTLHFTLEGFSQFSGVAFSNFTVVDNFKWRMMIMNNDVLNSSQGGKAHSLGVFLQCEGPESKMRDWCVSAHASIKLINHLNPDQSYSKEFDHCFSARSTDWGFSSYMKIKDVKDPSKGFLKDNDTLEFYAVVTTSSVENSKAQDVPAVLSCTLCNDRFLTEGNKQPMSLKCGHTFCLACLEKKLSNTDEGSVMLCCPVCTEEHTSPSGSHPWFPNHSMIQVINNVLLKPKHFCNTHQHDKNYFCFDDQSLICIYCAYHGEHVTHKCKHVEKAKEEVGISLQQVKEQAFRKSGELKRQLQLLNDEHQLFKSQEVCVEQQVNDFYTKVESALNQQKELTLQELKTHTNELTQSLDTHTKSLKHKYSEVQNAVEEYANWQTLSPQDALLNVSALQSKLHLVAGADVHAPLNSSWSSRICFELPSADSVLAALTSLGKITVEKRKRKNTHRDHTDSQHEEPSSKRLKE